MSEDRSRQIGATTALTKQISEADVALFDLVTRDELEHAEDEEPPVPARRPREAAPLALLAAILTSAVTRHSSHPRYARLDHQHIRFFAPVYTDDTVRAVAEITAYDPASQSIQIRASCTNQDSLRLAEGEFVLIDD